MSYLDIQLTAYTTTVTSFTQPAVASAVDVTVANTGWMPLGVALFISGAGYYTIERVLDATRVRVINTGGTGCVAEGVIVPANARVIAVGQSGSSGSSGGGGVVGSVVLAVGNPYSGAVGNVTPTDDEFCVIVPNDPYVPGSVSGASDLFEVPGGYGMDAFRLRFIGPTGDFVALVRCTLTIQGGVSDEYTVGLAVNAIGQTSAGNTEMYGTILQSLDARLTLTTECMVGVNNTSQQFIEPGLRVVGGVYDYLRVQSITMSAQIVQQF